MKLHKVTTADLQFIQDFCESRMLSAIGNMKLGHGDPVRELEQISIVLKAIHGYVPADMDVPAKVKKAA